MPRPSIGPAVIITAPIGTRSPAAVNHQVPGETPDTEIDASALATPPRQPSGRSPAAGEKRDDDDYAHLQPLLLRYAGLSKTDPDRARLREKLVVGFLPVARHLGRRYHSRGVAVEDLTQVATIGLINAIDRYDPARGRAFLAFAVPTIQGELRRYFRDRTWSARVPRRLKELHVRINQAHSPLAQQLGRAPTPKELAAYLQVPLEEVLDGLWASSSYSAASLDSTLERADDDGYCAGTHLGHLDQDLELVDVHQSVKPLLETLPDRERAILVMRFYGEYTQSQIGQRVGVSQMQVSRLLNQTLSRLREQLFAEE